jgi:membrane protease YdiL (CAAX protease family)
VVMSSGAVLYPLARLTVSSKSPQAVHTAKLIIISAAASYAAGMLVIVGIISSYLGWSFHPDIEVILRLLTNRVPWVKIAIVLDIAMLATLISVSYFGQPPTQVSGWTRRARDYSRALVAVASGLLFVLLLRNGVEWHFSVPHGHDVTLTGGANRSVPPIYAYIYSVFIVFVSPVVEELFFRGVLLTAYKVIIHRNYAVLLQALAFGAIHGIDSARGVALTTAFGVICGAACEFGGTVKVPVFIHVLGNILAFFKI